MHVQRPRVTDVEALPERRRVQRDPDDGLAGEVDRDQVGNGVEPGDAAELEAALEEAWRELVELRVDTRTAVARQEAGPVDAGRHPTGARRVHDPVRHPLRLLVAVR